MRIPESFVRGGPTLLFFSFMREGRIKNTTISWPSSATYRPMSRILKLVLQIQCTVMLKANPRHTFLYCSYPKYSNTLILCPLGNISCFFVFFFSKSTFSKMLSEIPSECQTDWFQIRPDVLSGLIWVQTVCKSYQQTTLGDKRVNV